MRAGGGDNVAVTLDSSLQIMSSFSSNWPFPSTATVTSCVQSGCASTPTPFECLTDATCYLLFWTDFPSRFIKGFGWRQHEDGGFLSPQNRIMHELEDIVP